MLIDTATLTQNTLLPKADENQIYNGLDCCVTFEVFLALQGLGDPPIYAFERALEAPALEIMLRGIKVDKIERDRQLVILHEKEARLRYILDRLADAVWDKPLNPRSFPQLIDFFYNYMKLPKVWTSIKGERGLHMNRESLEKLEVYFHAMPIVACIFGIREVAGKISVLENELDPDGRMRTSINVGATETGRFSSSKSTTGTGGNLFNITEELRSPFVSDPGWKLCGIDLEQAESREVGAIMGREFNDWRYLDACEAGDLHTTVSKMVWPAMAWTGNKIADRAIADTLFYRHFSHRDICKRLGHANNYLVQPWTASRILKIPLKIAEDFQTDYLTAFNLGRWHRWVAEQIQTKQCLTTMFSRERHFFGRPNDDTTLREAIAYEPQSCTADRLHVGMLRIWNHFGSRIQLLLDLYDAVYFQFQEDDNEEEIVREALELIDVPMDVNGRRFTVPGEAKTGWNWKSYGPDNPDGLKKFKGQDLRKRTPILERIL